MKWEVYGGIDQVKLRSGRLTLAIRVYRFTSERDAKDVARMAGRDSVSRIDAETRTKVAVKPARAKVKVPARAAKRRGRPK
jgi:hypothetical protein